MRIRRLVATSAVAASLAATGTLIPAVTPAAPADAAPGYWGAISWSYSGRTAYAVNFGSQNSAVRAAKARCGSNCGWISFHRSCGAVAYKFTSTRTRVGTARGYSTRYRAERAARSQAGRGSHIRGWACTAGR